MSTSAESTWVLRQHRRRATPRSELAARLAERILASTTHEQLLERMLQEDDLDLVESPRWSVSNHTEVAISLAMGWKNKALELEQSLSEKIAQLNLARSGSGGAAGSSIAALSLKRRSSAVDAAASPSAAAAAASSPHWGLPPLGSPLVKRAKQFEDKAMQTSTILGKDVETQCGNGEVQCQGCTDLKKQLANERRRVLFFQNENRRLEAALSSPLEEDAEVSMAHPDYAYAHYGSLLHDEALPAMSPALSVVPEGDEHEEGEMKQAEGEVVQEQQMELKPEESNIGEISPPDESLPPESPELANVGYLSDSPSPPLPPTPPPSPVMPSDPEDGDQPVAEETAAVVVQLTTFAASSVTVEDEPPGMDDEEAAEMDVEVVDPQLRALNAAAAGEAEHKAPSTDSHPAGLISTPQWAQARARAAGFTLPPYIEVTGQLLGWMSGGPEQLQRAKQQVERQREEERRQQTRDEEGKRSGEGMQD